MFFEVGSYFGYTTRFLSHLFKRVIALDAVPELLQARDEKKIKEKLIRSYKHGTEANREFNMDRENIMYLRLGTRQDHEPMHSQSVQVSYWEPCGGPRSTLESAK